MNVEREAWIARARAVPIETIVSRRGVGLRRNGKQLCGPCPICHEGDDLFWIDQTKNLWGCRKCEVSNADVIDLMQRLDRCEFMDACEKLSGEPPPRSNGKTKPYSPTAASFVYRDQEGRPVLRVQRTADKDFFQSHWTGETWKTGVPKGPKLPYRLPELIAAPTNIPVYITEGEGKADLLAKLGFIATSASGGASKWTADLNKWFADRHVRILIDNDAPGRKHGQLVAKNLDGIAADVRVVDLPGLPDKGDVKEWLQSDPTGARLVQACERAPVWEPATGGAATDEDAIAELAALAPLDYAKRRKEAAEAIGIGVGELDTIVAKARGDATVLSHLPSRWVVEPWDEPVSTGELLTELRDTFAQHVVLPQHGAAAMALWTLHAWAVDAAYVSPLLAFSSPEPRCGKSTALKLIKHTGPRTALASNISAAALFRYVEANQPTLVIDEADSFFHGNEEMRGILNSGHSRDTAFVIRCEGDAHTPKEFSTWGAKAIASIGKLAATLQDRAIVLPMKRKKPGERITKLREREDADRFTVLRRKASRWAEDNLEALRTARPALPEALNDRAQDNWEPLLAIADLAGDDWGKVARDAALKLSADAEAEGSSLSTQLLTDIRAAFRAACTFRFTSEELVKELTKDPAGNWAEFGKTGKPLTQKKLAAMLKGFDVRPTGNPRAYGYSAFRDAFDRYLPQDLPSQSSRPRFSNDRNGLEQNQSSLPFSANEDRNGCKSLEEKENRASEDRDPPLPETHGPEVPEDRSCARCRGPYDGSQQLCAVGDEIVWLHPQCQDGYMEGPPW
jgi:putative DNA primase/helicase